MSVQRWHAVAVPDESSTLPSAVPGAVLDAFGLAADTSAVPLGEGHIHRTWLVGGHTVVQRLNDTVFPDPRQVMQNRARITGQLLRRCPHWADRSPIRTTGGDLVAADPSTGRWRAHPFVPGTVPTHDAGLGDLRSAASAFGTFLAAMEDLDPRPAPTIVGFHDLDRRRRALSAAVAADRVERLAGCAREVDRARDLEVVVAPVAAAVAGLPIRTVHNDAKLANVVLDPVDRTPRAVLDLDTTMAGTAIVDVGELVRSSVSATAEDGAPSAPAGRVDPERFAAVVSGYLAGCDGRLTEDERWVCPWAGALMGYENAIRYLTDHLDGDRYFAVDRAGHNLERARAQLALTEDLIEARPELAAAMDRLG